MKMEMVVNGVALVIEGEFTIQMRPAGSAVPAVAPVVAAPVAVPVAAPVARPVAVQPASPVAPAVAAPSGVGLFARLSGLRRELAAASGVPPYVVFQDKTLREMVETMPQNLQELSQIQGVGQAKLEKYGDKFLAIIRAAAA